MKKRIMIILLLAVLTCALTACATPDKAPAGEFSYDVQPDGTATITGYTGKETEITIPAELDGYAVTGIGDRAASDYRFEKIIIPEGVVTIGNYAFYNCDGLTTIVLPTTLASIGSSAFRDCDVLTSIVIPDGIGLIGDYAFYSCDRLRDVTIPNSVTVIGQFAFEDCVSLREITIPGSVAEIGFAAFRGCENLVSVNICDGVGEIGEQAFSFCKNLRAITIPGSVAAIDESTFSSCSRLDYVAIQDGVTSIGKNAFYYCTPEIIHFPDSITFIDSEAFPELCRVVVFDSQDSYAAQFFRKKGLFLQCAYETVALEDGTLMIVACNVQDERLIIPAVLDGSPVTAIGANAFSACGNLVQVAIPDSVVRVEDNPFAGCSLLAEVDVSYLHPTLAVVDGALYSMADRRLICLPAASPVAEYNIPQGVQVIGAAAFANCTGLTRVVIPDSVAGIGEGAFDGCYRLETVDVGDNTAAAQYCKENHVPHTFTPVNDWLTD